MFENLVFNLDKSGIKGSSQAAIVAVKTILPMDQKNLVMDREFWLILK
jgi:hypothetical protein